MIRPWRRMWPLSGIVTSCFLACVAGGLAFSDEALGASNDAEAIKLRQAAIEQDYLATDFASAAKKLTQALALCKEGSDCSPATRGRLRCDLGVVLYAEQKKDEAEAQLVAAVKADPNVAISPDLTTPELQKQLAKVKAERVRAAEADRATGNEGDARKQRPSGAGAEGPAKTAPESDCPPGFPGCKSGTGSGATCSTNDDCSGGESCLDGSCNSGSSDQGEAVAAKANWLSVAAEEDFLLLPSADKVCAGGSGYTCFDSAGNYDKSIPRAGAPGDSVTGGLAPGTTRIMVGYDRAFGSNLTLGARVGFAFGGGPTRPSGRAFLPVHVEGRATYWFGRDALSKKGFRFFVLGAVGAAEIDSSLTAYVYNVDAPTGSQSLSYTAWKKTGQGFAGIGLGTMFAFGPSDGIVLEVRGMELFSTSGTALGAQLGYAHGI